jgi:hypothetical protein
VSPGGPSTSLGTTATHARPLWRLPTAPDQAHRDRGKQQRDQLGRAVQPALTEQTREAIGIPKGKSDQEQIREQGEQPYGR